MSRKLRYILSLLSLLATSGCYMMPQLGHQPMYHNPFPQLTKVAVAPFFNLSTEAAVDGRQFAEAYGNELQSIPGFEVVPVGVVERAMEAHGLTLDSPEQARQLAQQLGVDAIVVAAVTDYRPYYPPRCGLQVEWYAANPYFHQIPVGYGLPWGTDEEKEIPAPLVLEAEMGLAREQLKTQTPAFGPDAPLQPVAPPEGAEELAPPPGTPDDPLSTSEGEAVAYRETPDGAEPDSAVEAMPGEPAPAPPEIGEVPAGWPDARGLFPPPPTAQLGPLMACNEPVLRHTRSYDGADGEFTYSLSNYYFFRDDARGSNWRGYLTRMPDFIRFCCYRSITEMVTARGGADEARVVWRWPQSR